MAMVVYHFRCPCCGENYTATVRMDLMDFRCACVSAPRPPPTYVGAHVEGRDQ